jgi:hypothetical protein
LANTTTTVERVDIAMSMEIVMMTEGRLWRQRHGREYRTYVGSRITAADKITTKDRKTKDIGGRKRRKKGRTGRKKMTSYCTVVDASCGIELGPEEMSEPIT